MSLRLHNTAGGNANVVVVGKGLLDQRLQSFVLIDSRPLHFPEGSAGLLLRQRRVQSAILPGNIQRRTFVVWPDLATAQSRAATRGRWMLSSRYHVLLSFRLGGQRGLRLRLFFFLPIKLPKRSTTSKETGIKKIAMTVACEHASDDRRSQHLPRDRASAECAATTARSQE